MKRVLFLATLVCFAPTFAACTAILGVRDIPSATSDEGGVTDDGSTSVNGDVLASNMACPRFLALDSQTVYWLTALGGKGSIYACAITGCQNNPINLAQNQDAPEGIASDGTIVYWGTTTGLFACPAGGCNKTPRQLSLSNNIPYNFFGVAVANGVLFATDPGEAQVVSIPTSSTSAALTDLLPATGTTLQYETITTDGFTLYFTLDAPLFADKVYSCPITGCKTGATSLAINVAGPKAIYVHNGYVYWMTTSNGITVQSCASGGCNESPATLYQSKGTTVSSPDAWGLAVDDVYVYFTDGTDDTIKRCSNLGCTGSQPDIIATNAKYASGLVVDANNIYWGMYEPGCTGGSSVMRVPKPQ